METEVNMYEVAARHKKAGRLAVALLREFSDIAPHGLAPGAEGDRIARAVADAYGINPPSDETIAQVRELLDEWR